MILSRPENIVKKNFSKYAEYYDRYSKVQDLCAEKLITALPAGDFKTILDIGCGTGTYTKLLKQNFPRSCIRALDISPEMIKRAEAKLGRGNVDFIVQDAEEKDINGAFDLITSNAAFQWFADIEKLFFKYKGCINENGVLFFSTFGPETFKELGFSLRELYGSDVSISASNFKEKQVLEDILRNIFQGAKVEEHIVQKGYNSLWELLTSIKYTGTRGCALQKRLWTVKAIGMLENIYSRNFGGITATYQIFICRGKR